MAEQQLQGTPTIKLNGEVIDNSVAAAPQELRDTVTEAAK
jgi:hypothetical protein